MKSKTKIPPDDPAKILERIRYFCSYRERSKREVEQKLRSMKVPVQKIRGILDMLADDRFQDDARFASTFAISKWKVNHWGRVRIGFELRSNGIPENLIRQSLEEINEEEYREKLKELMVKKAKEYFSEEKFRLKDKISNFALGKGYESSLVFEILREIKF